VVNKTLTIIGGTSISMDTSLSLTDATLGPILSFLGSVNVTLRYVHLFANLTRATQTYDVVRVDGAKNITFANVDVLILSVDGPFAGPINPSIRVTSTEYFSVRYSNINVRPVFLLSLSA
jgi:hypothetical protein